MYFTKLLYPKMVETENLLRKLIYIFMIKTAGSSWFTDTVPKSVKEAIERSAKMNNKNGIPSEDQLYLADFIQLGAFFFQKYTLKPFGPDVISNSKRTCNGLFVYTMHILIEHG